MKNIFRFFQIIILIIFLSSCGGKEEKISVLKEGSLEDQMIELFYEGYDAYLEDGDTFFATQKFNEAELVYPQSKWAPVAALMAAFIYYDDDYYDDAIYEIERYLKVYPNHKDRDYAHYLLGICYYENIIDEKRDLAPLLNAKKKFEFIVTEYPDTDFALDSKLKIQLIEDRLAGKEMYIGRHYMKAKKWIPAINRFKNVIEIYDTSAYVEEALHRLAELHHYLGLESESKKYATLLGYNYGSGKWYKATYKIFNKNYNFEENKIFDQKKIDKETMLNRFKKRFKSLFN